MTLATILSNIWRTFFSVAVVFFITVKMRICEYTKENSLQNNLAHTHKHISVHTLWCCASEWRVSCKCLRAGVCGLELVHALRGDAGQTFTSLLKWLPDAVWSVWVWAASRPTLGAASRQVNIHTYIYMPSFQSNSLKTLSFKAIFNVDFTVECFVFQAECVEELRVTMPDKTFWGVTDFYTLPRSSKANISPNMDETCIWYHSA